MIKEKIFLVTGAAGHLGNVLVEELIKRKEKVRAFILENEVIQFDQVEVVKGDVRSKDSLRPFFSNLENFDIYLVHCAGIVSISSKYDEHVYDVNVNGTKNVMDLALEYKVKKVVHISSVHAISELSNNQKIVEVSSFNPDGVHGLYAKTKAEVSQYVLVL